MKKNIDKGISLLENELNSNDSIRRSYAAIFLARIYLSGLYGKNKDLSKVDELLSKNIAIESGDVAQYFLWKGNGTLMPYDTKIGAIFSWYQWRLPFASILDSFIDTIYEINFLESADKLKLLREIEEFYRIKCADLSQ